LLSRIIFHPVRPKLKLHVCPLRRGRTTISTA
jgi:hypothetical protein